MLWDYLEQIVVARVCDDLGGHSAAENGVSLDVAGAVNVDAGDDLVSNGPVDSYGVELAVFDVSEASFVLHGCEVNASGLGVDDAMEHGDELSAGELIARPEEVGVGISPQAGSFYRVPFAPRDILR